MVLQQERIAEKWKFELEQAVENYESIIKKLKAKNKVLMLQLENS